MGNWWDIAFTATGRELEIERLLSEIGGLKLRLDDANSEVPAKLLGWAEGRPLFASAEVKYREPGYLSMQASRNYFGSEVIEQLAGLFPDLAFTGSLYNDMNCFNTGGWYVVFDSPPGDGKVFFQEYDMPADSIVWEPAEPVDDPPIPDDEAEAEAFGSATRATYDYLSDGPVDSGDGALL